MKLSQLERTVISNQLKILEKLYPEEAKRYQRDRKAIEEGYVLEYGRIAGQPYDELSIEGCREVLDILKMYRALNFSYNKLDDKSGLESSKIRFPGFDGNDEEEGKMMGYVEYFLHDLGKHEELHREEEYYDYNSHGTMLNTYRKMMDIWIKHEKSFDLTAKQIIEIINPYGLPD